MVRVSGFIGVCRRHSLVSGFVGGIIIMFYYFLKSNLTTNPSVVTGFVGGVNGRIPASIK